MRKLLSILLFFAAQAFAQSTVTTTTAANPAAGCTAGQACSGTTITATTTFTGTSYTLTGTGPSPTNGFSLIDANTLDVSVGGGGRVAAFRALGNSDAGLLLNSTTMVGFAPSTIYSVADIRLTRSAAGLLLISGDGTGTASGQTGWKIGNLSADPTYSLLTGSQAASLSRANSVLNTNGTTTSLNAPNNGSGLFFTIHDITKGRFTVAAGSGLAITAGTTSDNTQRALSITQTWTNGTSSNMAIEADITSGTGTGYLMALRTGGSSKFYVTETGVTYWSAGVGRLTTNGTDPAIAAGSGLGFTIYTDNANVRALDITSAGVFKLPLIPSSSGTRYLCIDNAGVVTSSASACSGT